MALSDGGTLLDRFLTAQSVLDSATPRRRRVGRTYQGFIKALMRLSDTLLPQVADHLRATIRSKAGDHWTRFGWVMFAVDGSKIDAVRSSANESAFGVTAKSNGGPQQLLTTLWHMGTGLPWAWVTSRVDGSERHHLREMIRLLPANSLLVADAGFSGFELLRELELASVAVLLRVGGNVRLLRDLGCAVEERADTVYLWPHRHRKSKPLVFRLIQVVPADGSKPVFLITSVLEPGRLPAKTAAMIYQMRWGIEVFYRSLKQTLQRRKMRSAAPRQAALELHWTLIGMMILGLMSVSAIIARGRDPLSWSVAAAARIVRRIMNGPAIAPRTLLRRLGFAAKDQSPRRSSKKARNWPHKKTSKPPEPPQIRHATITETDAAQQLVACCRTT